MENKETKYNCQTYNPFKAALYAFPIYILLIVILYLTTMPLHMPMVGVVGWILISTVPFLYQKRFKLIFTRKIELTFNNQSLVIQEYALKSGSWLKEVMMTWAEMESFKCSFSSGVTYLTIGLRDGSKHNFSFEEEKTEEQTEEEIINEKGVFSIFYYYVCQYNSTQQPNDAIIVKPGFLVTMPGAILLYGLTVLAIAAIIIHAAMAPKTFGLSFMSFFIIIGLVAKRKTDKVLYNKIKELEPTLDPGL